MMALDKLDDDDVKYLTEFAKPGELDRYRLQAIAALGMVGGKERKVIPTLVDFLSEKQSPVIVAAACRALAGIGDPGEKAEAALIAVCKDDKLDEQVRFQAIYALASISSKSKSAIPALIELLADKDPNVIMTAIQALGSLEEPGGAGRTGHHEPDPQHGRGGVGSQVRRESPGIDGETQGEVNGRRAARRQPAGEASPAG